MHICINLFLFFHNFVDFHEIGVSAIVTPLNSMGNQEFTVYFSEIIFNRISYYLDLGLYLCLLFCECHYSSVVIKLREKLFHYNTSQIVKSIAMKKTKMTFKMQNNSGKITKRDYHTKIYYYSNFDNIIMIFLKNTKKYKHLLNL